MTDEVIAGPRRYAEIVGQPDAVSRLKAFSDFHLKNGSAPGHVLVIGEEGTGRTTIARTLVHELGLSFQEIDSSTLQILGDLTVLITNARSDWVQIYREIHRLKRNLLEMLIDVLRTQKLEFHIGKGASARRWFVDVVPFPLIGTVTRRSDCSSDLLSCFSLVLQLQPYSNDALAQIAEQVAAHANFEIDSESARLIAINSSGRPHQVELLIQRVAKAVRKQRITADDTIQALSAFGMNVRTSTTSDNEPLTADMSGVEFERIITALLTRMEFRAELTKATGDGGIDIVAILDKPILGGKYLFQCKRYAPDNLVGAATVRDFYGAVTADKAVKGVLITTSDFTAQAREFAERVGLELINLGRLQDLLAQYGMTDRAHSVIAKS
jgi:Holliday junction resolvasome RuvABC ATP-dependent DNA helicase subunit